MTTEYLIRPFSADHFEDIAPLLSISLHTPGIPRTREFWMWKHVQNPFGVSPAVVAEHNQRIIGLRIFMNWGWKAEGKDLKAVRAVDTVTHPEWRGKGIFSRLTSTLLEDMRTLGVSFVFNTPNRSSKPGYLKMGWQQITRIPLMVRPLKPFRAAMGLFHKRQVDLESDRKPGLLDFDGLSCLKEYLESFSKENRLHTNRTVAYLQWRYTEIPGISYHAKWKNEDDVFALMIFRERIRKGLSELSISELLLSENEKGICLGKDLLDETARESSADYMVAVAARSTPEHAAFKHAGFFTLPDLGPALTVKPLQKPEDFEFFDWHRWRCSIGDLEVF